MQLFKELSSGMLYLDYLILLHSDYSFVEILKKLSKEDHIRSSISRERDLHTCLYTQS